MDYAPTFGVALENEDFTEVFAKAFPNAPQTEALKNAAANQPQDADEFTEEYLNAIDSACNYLREELNEQDERFAVINTRENWIVVGIPILDIGDRENDVQFKENVRIIVNDVMRIPGRKCSIHR